MKLLLLLVIVLLGAWLWRSGRHTARPPKASHRGPSEPQAMVACPHCGAHLPAEDGVRGQRGLYCSVEHRQAVEA